MCVIVCSVVLQSGQVGDVVFTGSILCLDCCKNVCKNDLI